MKTSFKHLLCLSLAAGILLAGQACKKSNNTTTIISQHPDSIYYVGEWHYYEERSSAPFYGPDTGGVIIDTFIRFETVAITDLDTSSSGVLDSVNINGTKFFNRIALRPPFPDNVIFYQHYDSMHLELYSYFSSHSFSCTKNIFYGRKIH